MTSLIVRYMSIVRRGQTYIKDQELQLQKALEKIKTYEHAISDLCRNNAFKNPLQKLSAYQKIKKLYHVFTNKGQR